jgi:hypothetical protein
MHHRETGVGDFFAKQEVLFVRSTLQFLDEVVPALITMQSNHLQEQISPQLFQAKIDGNFPGHKFRQNDGGVRRNTACSAKQIHLQQ